MKTRHHIAVIAAALTATAIGQTTTWYHGGFDNKTNFSVTADSTQAITWMDGWAGGTSNDASYTGSQSLQVNRPSLLGLEQGIILYGFGGITAGSADITSAMLYLRSDYAFPVSGPANTWNIVGLAAGNSNWDVPGMTWNDINGGAVGDWTGGDLLGSLTGSYGSFMDLGTGVDGNIVIDITSAFKAYQDGAISGIAFVNSTPGDGFNGSDYAFSPYSNESAVNTNRPGLLVTVTPIPEPSVALLGGLGVLCLLRRRR